MVKISIAPPQFVVNLFYKIVGDPGTVSPLTILPLAPSKGDIPDLSFKDKEKMVKDDDQKKKETNKKEGST